MRPTPSSQRAEEIARELLQQPAGAEGFVIEVVKNLGPEGQQWIIDHFLRHADSDDGNSSFAKLIGARQVDRGQQQALELAALTNFFNYRRNLLSNSIPATKAAEILGVSRTTIHDRIRSGQFLGIIDNNIMKMPIWQFDPAGTNGAVEGLEQVLSALSCNLLAKISWLCSPNPVFANKKPIDALKERRVEEVVAEARAVQSV